MTKPARPTPIRTLARSAFIAVALIGTSAASAQVPIDTDATAETRALFANMIRIAPDNIMFGHQNTLAYGYTWRDEPNRSDVKDVAGAFPAVYGWDIMDIFARGDPDRIDPARAERLRGFVREAHARGGINTFSWHMPNPVNGTDAWNVERAVEHIVPGGRLHDAYRAKLDLVAAFFLSLTDSDGRPIPVWFRPFHEHTGAWFWWGKGNATAADFQSLWRFTVRHLRDDRDVHNLLYAYSTDVFDDEQTYFEFYPGDDYVDLLGFDDYHSIKSASTRGTFVRRLEMVSRWATDRGKLSALTETGLEAIPDPGWWTNVLLPALHRNADTRGISYVLVWRNANPAFDRRAHFYAPYRGHASAADFVTFTDAPGILLEDELPPMYR